MADRDRVTGRIRRLFEPPALLADPIVQCFALIALTSAFFLLFPGVDLWFSGLFYEPGDGFPMARLGAFAGLRQFHRYLTWLIGVGLAMALIAKLALPSRPSIVRPRDILFIAGTLAIGPGLIVNLVFKNNWGRPRPYAVDHFGGDQPFIGVWQMTDHCNTNCSFVSGEASSAIWLVTLAVLVPPRWRPAAVEAIVILAALLALNRIATGGHFLSDVLLSWWMTLAVIAAAYRILYVNPPAPLADDRMEAGLTRAGLALRRVFSGSGA